MLRVEYYIEFRVITIPVKVARSLIEAIFRAVNSIEDISGVRSLIELRGFSSRRFSNLFENGSGILLPSLVVIFKPFFTRNNAAIYC